MKFNQTHPIGRKRCQGRNTAKLSSVAGVVVLSLAAVACAATGPGASNSPTRQAGDSAMAQTDLDYEPITRAARFTKVGSRGEAAYIFAPRAKESGTAPLVVFFHGLAATDPFSYGGWIDHLVDRGNIVIYPVAENTKFDRARKIRRNAIVGVRSAINYLQQGRLKPDLNRVSYVGHSVGGGLSVQLAADAKTLGLPTPKAIMPVQSGGSKNPTDIAQVNRLPSRLLLLAIDGDQDQFEDSREGRMIVMNANAVPAKNRGYIVLRSSSSLIADHYAPLSPDLRYQMLRKSGRKGRRALMKMFGARDGEFNALDRNGFWRLFDDLMDAAYAGGTVTEVMAASGATPIDSGVKSRGAAFESQLVQLMQLSVR
ncbi:MAG: alpha/beta hydrolase [Pseudomonadota bacterium]